MTEPTCYPLGKFSTADFAPHDAGPAADEWHSLRILVAEDDYITRRVLVMFLNHEGHSVTSVENGQECLEEAQRNSYDLILSDIDMPQMTGIECATQLRAAGIETPIIALSSSAAYNPREECLRAGMNEFLPKPVPPDKLRATLREASAGRMKRPVR